MEESLVHMVFVVVSINCAKLAYSNDLVSCTRSLVIGRCLKTPENLQYKPTGGAQASKYPD